MEEIITSSNEVFNDFESDMAVGFGMLGNLTENSAEGNDTANQTAACLILTLQLQEKKIRSVRHCMHICEVEYKGILKRLTA